MACTRAGAAVINIVLVVGVVGLFGHGCDGPLPALLLCMTLWLDRQPTMSNNIITPECIGGLLHRSIHR